jgi:hypothetical protein
MLLKMEMTRKRLIAYLFYRVPPGILRNPKRAFTDPSCKNLESLTGLPRLFSVG